MYFQEFRSMFVLLYVMLTRTLLNTFKNYTAVLGPTVAKFYFDQIITTTLTVLNIYIFLQSFAVF